MARLSAMMDQSAMPTIFFHQKTFGQNIQLDNNALKAIRHTSFDNGITFTNKQIKMNEHVHMKIVDIDESGQWLGSLAIGFIQIDPGSIQRHELYKSAIPSICQKTGVSYVKRIFERLTRQTVITFYYNQEGAFYILDGKEQEICKNIDVQSPMWGAVLITPPKTIADSRTFFIKYDQKPDKLPIQYFTHLKPTNLQSVVFHDVHGPELDLYCQNKVVFRKNVRRLSRPYLFINFPMRPDDELYIRILSVDLNYRTPGVIGFTTAEPSNVVKNIDKLPADDPMGLYDRPEFWIINEDGFDESLSELDEYRFVYDRNGEIRMWRNNESIVPTRTVAFADPSQAFYPFFFLNGRIMALSLIGLVSSTKIVPVQPTPKKKDDDAGLCQLCLDTPANCAMIPCGHIFFCSDCKSQFEGKSKLCPICRAEIKNIFEIESD
ncbi:unnamed protein product [Rotaria sp. Silwood2]|nr:unnamed protein product [Rotaria sp. Silwood2]CAF2806233.1 unnamed protein product [Rotaria sp. Silwood2]CAF2967299.1 unnamed protein product [Rotaria sp. Silwood2]CAF3919701.1 unnamed protein product [Rotaria sp. Silwood2]CAF4110781.1 unnamed protein product [Rotaria sp. Silwood2]